MATDDDATHGRKPKPAQDPNGAIDDAIKACVEAGDFDRAAALIELRKTSRPVAPVVALVTRRSR